MRLSPLLLLLLSFCAWSAEPPKLRVGDELLPVSYKVDLTLTPGATSFTGTVDIEIELAKPTSLVWINAADITVKQASIGAGGHTQPANVDPGNSDFIGLATASPVPAGAASIHIAYEGKISINGSEGIFQGVDAGEKYLYTQFESIDARHAFPCFDQPNFKTPWKVTLHVPRGDKAFSNSPQVAEADEPGDMKRVEFAPTKPLPSYLVAFAVGPFDVVDGGKTPKSGVPVRIIVPKGKAPQAKFAAEVTAAIIGRLEDYFGIPYPWEKADQVAIPLTFGFGAMENAALVTYAQSLILADPATDSIQRQRGYVSVAAHELAHQWFGDLVTTAWWNDIWLNEAFATWMSSRIRADWHPDWNTRLGDLQATFGAMGNDSLVSARKIRQPIESKNDIANAFDGITYEKGAAVIRMFEIWLGEDKFRAGVSSYLRRYANRSARSEDFLDALASPAKPGLTQAFSTFLEQAGTPEVSVDLRCQGAPAVYLTQKRYLPIGSTGSKDALWRVPVCVWYTAGGSRQSECFLLDKPAAEFKLSKAAACPTALSANADATGYYIANYQGGLLAALEGLDKQHLTAVERVSLLHDLGATAVAGDSKISGALEIARTLASDPERQVVAEARSIVASAKTLVPDDLLPNYETFVRRTFGERAMELGWSPKPDESAETTLLRANLVPWVAVEGQVAPLIAEARRLADGWLENRKGITGEMTDGVLTTAASAAGQDFFDALLRELKKTEDLHQRETILSALGSFHDPAIARQAMMMAMGASADVRETVGLFFAPLNDRRTDRLPFDFVRANYDAIMKRLPAGAGFQAAAYLPLTGRTFCDEKSRLELVDFFQDRVKQYLGGPRIFAQVLEGIKLCEAQRAAQTGDVKAFFAKP